MIKWVIKDLQVEIEQRLDIEQNIENWAYVNTAPNQWSKENYNVNIT